MSTTRTRTTTNRRRYFRATIALGVLAGAVAGFGAPLASAESAHATATVTLHIFQAEGDEPQPWQVTEFERAYPNIKVDVSEVPFSEFYAKEAILAASSNPPDVYAVDQPTIANLAAAGVIMPLTKYLSPSYVNAMNPAAKTAFSYKGQLYSPGPVDTTEALFYNENLLSAAGIHPPTTLAKAWTWPDALAAMEACQAAGKSSNVVGLQPRSFGTSAGSDYTSMLFLQSEGNPNARKSSTAYKTFFGIAPSGNSVTGYLNSRQAVAGATFFQDLFQKYKVSSTSGNPNAFIDGGACFAMEASNFVGSLKAANVNFKWGVTPWPYFTTPIVHTGSVEVAVSSKTRHLTQALDFIKFVSSPTQQAEILKHTGFLPVLTNLYTQLPQLRTAPWSTFVQELAQWGEPRPVTPHYLQYSQVVTSAMTDIADGAPVQARLNQAVVELNQLLQGPAGSL